MRRLAWPSVLSQQQFRGPAPQIREDMSGPDLHVFTLEFLVLKKLVFFHFLGVKKKLKFFYKKGIMQLFSADYGIA